MQKIGNVQIFFGAEGIRNAYELSLQAKELNIVCLSNEYSNVIGSYFDKEYAPRLYESDIRTREVLVDTEGNREDATSKDVRKNQVKFIKEIKKSESDFMLNEDKAILVSYNANKPYAVVIEDPDLVANLQNQFEALWKSL